MKDLKKIIQFIENEISLEVKVSPEEDTIWLTKNQMAELFEKDPSTIAYHIHNIFDDQELEESETTTEIFDEVLQKKLKLYNLDVIISIGYRAKSRRGIAFRKWALNVLKEYLVHGYAINEKELSVPNYTHLVSMLDSYRQAAGGLNVSDHDLLDFLLAYDKGLKILDDYDHHNIHTPLGHEDVYKLTYEECMEVIRLSTFQDKGDNFAIERDDSFRSSIAAVYQSFGGEDLYPTLESKAAHLLYFITKNHSFVDGNKRIAATIFLYFLDKNQALYRSGHKRITDETLATLTILIASSNPDDKELIINLIMVLIN